MGGHRRGQEVSPSKDRRQDPSHPDPYRSHSRDRTHSFNSRDHYRSLHHRESRTSPQRQKDNPLTAFSPYEEYVDYFHKWSSSKEDFYSTQLDRSTFSDTLR